ncbi:MAG: polysialyltransferase family glycosyltransferase [Flavobacteriales bacterium]
MSSSQTYRVFVVSNPVSAIHASLLAASQEKTHIYVLVLDNSPRKASFSKEIINAASGFAWNSVVDLSISLNETTDHKPSLRKRITRRIKHLPVIKSIYNLLLSNYEAEMEKNAATLLKDKFPGADFSSNKHALYLLTQTRANTVLKNLFTNAPYYYFEHGLPDYLFSQKDNDARNSGIYCLFHKEFKQYLEKRKASAHTFPFVTESEYISYLERVYRTDERILKLRKELPARCTLLMLQPFEKYELPSSFWFTYIEAIQKHENPVCYVIKPHPLQSNETMQQLKSWLQNQPISFILLDEPDQPSLSCEVLYALLKDKFVSVYSPFSYSLYFLAKFLPSNDVSFYHSYNSMEKKFRHSPLQFKNQFLEHKEIIEECFSINCRELLF